jgi:hypothetical protein
MTVLLTALAIRQPRGIAQTALSFSSSDCGRGSGFGKTDFPRDAVI